MMLVLTESFPTPPHAALRPGLTARLFPPLVDAITPCPSPPPPPTPQPSAQPRHLPLPPPHPLHPTTPPQPPPTPYTLSCITQLSERNFFLRSKMQSRMEEMRTAEAYVRERRTRWDNDTRGLLKEADRLLRKRRPAPPGYLDRIETSRSDQPWKPWDGDFGEGKGVGGGSRKGVGPEQQA